MQNINANHTDHHSCQCHLLIGGDDITTYFNRTEPVPLHV